MENGNKKEKVINVGMTDGLMNLLDKWMEQNAETDEKREEKPGLEVKRVIADIAIRQLVCIRKKLEIPTINDSEWDNLMEKIDRISNLVGRWY